MSTIQRNIIVDMQLSFYNRSRVNGSIENLFSVVQSGALGTIPVQRGSLVIEGLPKVSRHKNLDLNPTFSVGLNLTQEPSCQTTSLPLTVFFLDSFNCYHYFKVFYSFTIESDACFKIYRHTPVPFEQ